MFTHTSSGFATHGKQLDALPRPSNDSHSVGAGDLSGLGTLSSLWFMPASTAACQPPGAARHAYTGYAPTNHLALAPAASFQAMPGGSFDVCHARWAARHRTPNPARHPGGSHTASTPHTFPHTVQPVRTQSGTAHGTTPMTITTSTTYTSCMPTFGTPTWQASGGHSQLTLSYVVVRPLAGNPHARHHQWRAPHTRAPTRSGPEQVRQQ